MPKVMNDDKLIEIATSLEATVIDSKSQIKCCKPEHCAALTANRSGFVRLAALCLRTAAEPIPEGECRSKPIEIASQHDQVVDHASDVIICFLQRMETWPETNEYIEARKKRALRNDRPALLACGIVGFAILFVIILGISTIIGWFR